VAPGRNLKDGVTRTEQQRIAMMAAARAIGRIKTAAVAIEMTVIATATVGIRLAATDTGMTVAIVTTPMVGTGMGTRCADGRVAGESSSK
jgi:uncharacterized membrane protein